MPETPEKTVLLDDWSVTTISLSPYDAPELSPPALQGHISGHEGFEDGTHVKTGRIKEAKGRIVTCEEGSDTKKVRLGRIAPEYRRWLRKHRPDWNWREPVTIFR